MEQGILAKGFYRVRIAENGEFVGDSGWHENLITNEGFRDYLVRSLGALAGSKQVSHIALGTGGVPAATDTTLSGEVVKRAAVTASSSATSKSVQFVATFDSAQSFVTNTQNIANIAMVNSSNLGTIFAGNTFASSSVATNQSVYVTYNVNFV